MDKPKIIVVLGVGLIIIAFVAYSYYSNSQYQHDVENAFGRLSAQDIEEASVLLWVCDGDDPVTLKPEYWPILVQELKQLKHTSSIGSRGPWQIHRAIILRAKNFGAVKIFLTKRPDTLMLASVDSGGQSTYFEGVRLWNWLITIPEVKNQKIKEKKSC